MPFTESQRDFGRKACEIGLGVLIAVLIAHLTAKSERSIVDDVLVGLLTTMVIAFLWEPIDQKRGVRELTERVDFLNDRVREMKAGIDAVNGDFADQLDRYTLALRFTNKNLARDEMPNAWERMLWSMRGNFDATSFIRPSDYSRAYPDYGVAIQELKVKVTKSRVRRIFIVEDEDELRLMQAHMARQAEAHILVSYVLQREIRDADIDLSRYETLDFGLFDDSKSVFLWILNNRSLAGGKIELNNDQYRKYRTLFDQLCKLSHDWEPVKDMAA